MSVEFRTPRAGEPVGRRIDPTALQGARAMLPWLAGVSTTVAPYARIAYTRSAVAFSGMTSSIG